MHILLESKTKQNSTRPFYFSSITAYILIATIQNRNRIARAEKHQKQNRYTGNIIEIDQMGNDGGEGSGEGDNRIEIDQKQNRYTRNIVEIDQTGNDGGEGSGEGDNRIEVDQKQNRYTRNIVEMKQKSTRRATMEVRVRGG